MQTRRQFLRHGVILATIPAMPSLWKLRNDAAGSVMTVNGPIQPEAMGLSLIHEHVMVDFIGADHQTRDRYDADDVYKMALPHLKAVQQLGCRAMVECTPAYLGRDVKLLQQLSATTGIHLITNTGYYGASGEKYFPKHVSTSTAEEIAQMWINEFKNGIDGTTVRPGFIKSGVDNAPLTNAQRKVIEAAGITHLETGLPIAIHTGDGKAAQQQLDILAATGVSPEARIWVHAQNEKNLNLHVNAARRKSWISFDGVNTTNASEYVGYLSRMKIEGLLRHVLVSQDSGWYHVGENKGGTYNGYTSVFRDFIPALRKNGFSEREVNEIFVTNPARAFTIGAKRI